MQTPFDTEILGTVIYEQGFPFVSLHTHSKLAKYNVVINSGAHGEEIIAIRVMLRFIAEFNKELLNHYNFIIFPVINPYGYTYNRRKNGQGILANTGFTEGASAVIPNESILIRDALPNKIDLFIDVHADTGARGKTGFYIYERKRPEAKSIAEVSLKELKKNKIPILDNDTVYGEKCENGVIVSPIKDGSMDDSMFKRGAIYSLCLEIPGRASEEQQMLGGLMLINSVLNQFKELKK